MADQFPPRHTNPHRPYARKRKYGASVTTVLGSLGGGQGLRWAAVRETVDFALDFPDEWQHLDRDAAFARLYRHHQGLWDGRASMGSVVHAINEDYTWGRTADIDAIVARVAESTPIWRGREPYVAADAEGYVDGLDAFWADYRPDTIATEEIVRHEDPSAYKHSYIGTRDWTARLHGLDGVTLLDIKTTAKQWDAEKPDDGLYWDKFRLQLAAYRMAETVVRFEGDEIVESWPNYPVARCCVLHLRGDGRYQLFEVRAEGDEWARFLRLIDLHRWATTGHKEPAAVDLTVYKASEEVA